MVRSWLTIFAAVGLAVCSTGPMTTGGVTIVTDGFNSNVTDWTGRIWEFVETDSAKFGKRFYWAVLAISGNTTKT